MAGCEAAGGPASSAATPHPCGDAAQRILESPHLLPQQHAQKADGSPAPPRLSTAGLDSAASPGGAAPRRPSSSSVRPGAAAPVPSSSSSSSTSSSAATSGAAPATPARSSATRFGDGRRGSGVGGAPAAAALGVATALPGGGGMSASGVGGVSGAEWAAGDLIRGLLVLAVGRQRLEAELRAVAMWRAQAAAAASEARAASASSVSLSARASAKARVPWPYSPLGGEQPQAGSPTASAVAEGPASATRVPALRLPPQPHLFTVAVPIVYGSSWALPARLV